MLLVLSVSIAVVLLSYKSKFDLKSINENKYCLPSTTDNEKIYNQYNSTRLSIKNLKTELEKLKSQENKLLKSRIELLNDAIKNTSLLESKLAKELNYCSKWCSETETANWTGKDYKCTCFSGYGDNKNYVIDKGLVTCKENPQNLLAIDLKNKIDKEGGEFSTFLQDFRVYPKLQT